jgi:uncharacterized membrane protein YfcA
MFYLVVGLAAGVCSGLFGIGGGVIIVPALIFLQGFKPQAAVGTSLAALLLPVGALGVWTYWKNGDVQWKAGLAIALGLLLGAYVGARIGVPLSPRTLKRSFAVFLVAAAALTWARS